MIKNILDFMDHGGYYNQMSWGGKKEEYLETLEASMLAIEKAMENTIDENQLEKMNNTFWTKLELLKQLKENDPELASWALYNLKLVYCH